MSARHVALLAALAAIWGASYLLIKWALEGFSPGFVVFTRTALAAVLLYVLVRARGGATLQAVREARRRPRAALVLGTLAIAVPFLLITFGELAVPSGLTAVLIAPASLFVAAFAPFLDRSEAIDRSQVAGLVSGLAGVALLVGVESVQSLGEFLGALAILAASASYALSSFVVKGAFAGRPAVAVSCVACAVGALLTAPLALATLPDRVPGLRPVAALVVLGAAGTALAFVIFYGLIADVGAGRASLVSYLAPGVALAYGALLLDEKVTVAALVGLVLILGGVAVSSRRRAEPPEGGEVVLASGSAPAGVATAPRR